MTQMKDLGLDRWIQKMCDKMNFKNPTEIQEKAIPKILQKKNIIAVSETGSGKTACFGFPILQDIAKDPTSVHSLILTPNRELAFQIQEQMSIFGVNVNLRLCTLVGGVDMLKQSNEIGDYPHVIVATPGRLVDTIEREPQLRELLENLRFLVLDEVDRLMDESILPDIMTIMEHIPKKRQNVLTTATLDQEGEKQIKEVFAIDDFDIVNVMNEKKTVQSLTQEYIFIPDQLKDNYFIHLLMMNKEKSCIVFVANCIKCHNIYMLLKEIGFEATCLHSYLPQRQRIVNLKRFRNESAQVLVATDVASRGLDIQVVDLVINFDIPYDATDYIHRVGRVARGGKAGTAISVVTQFDIELILNIEEHIGEKLETLELDEKKVMDNMLDVTKARKVVKIKMLEQGILEDFEKQKQARKAMKVGKKINKIKFFSKLKKDGSNKKQQIIEKKGSAKAQMNGKIRKNIKKASNQKEE